MATASDLSTAYRIETEQLTAERTPQAIALLLGSTAGYGVLESVLYPGAESSFSLMFAMQAVVAVLLCLARRSLLQRRLLTPASVVVALILSLLGHAHSVAAALPTELQGIAAVCTMTGMSLLMPWGARGQVIVSAGNLLAYGGGLLLNGAVATPPALLMFYVTTGAALTVIGARYLDLHRFAIFREATAYEDEAVISRSLVGIAKEINAVLGTRDVLNRIAGATRTALGCDWSLILLWDNQRNAFRIAGGDSRTPGPFEELGSIEFGRNAFPLIERVLSEGYLEIPAPGAADVVTAGLMRRWQTDWLLASTLRSSDQLVGIIAAGGNETSQALSERARQLFRDVAPHAAIALNNVRLVADLRQADCLKSEFVSTISHELRTPLNVILGYSDMLLDEAFGPILSDQLQILSRLRDSARSLSDLIGATLDANRLEAGRSAVHVRELDLSELLAEAKRESQELPRKSGVVLRWGAHVDHHRIRTDASKLKIILRNLVGNALKFTDSGQVAVQAQYNPASGMLDLKVTDTGPGVNRDDLAHIFEMFRQSGTAIERGGVGLGLYIVKRFVEQLGGKITVSSRPGVGSTFRVSLPVTTAAEAVAEEEIDVTSSFAAASSPPPPARRRATLTSVAVAR